MQIDVNAPCARALADVGFASRPAKPASGSNRRPLIPGQSGFFHALRRTCGTGFARARQRRDRDVSEG